MARPSLSPAQFENFYSAIKVQESTFQQALHQHPLGKLWMSFAEDCDRLGWQILAVLDVPLYERCPFTVAAYFARVHESFGSAVRLLERGRIGDARAITRVLLEGAMALQALSKNEDFIDDILNQHHGDSLKKFQEIVAHPELLATLKPEQEQIIRTEIAKLELLPAKERKRIIWRDVATKYCPDLYFPYSALSEDGVHVSLSAVTRRYEMVGTKITHLKAGPDVTGFASSMRDACICYLQAFDPFLKFYPSDEWGATGQLLATRLKEMPEGEIDGLEVEAT